MTERYELPVLFTEEERAGDSERVRSVPGGCLQGAGMAGKAWRKGIADRVDKIRKKQRN